MGMQGEKKCPRCGVEFEKRNGERCPECNVLLKFKRGKTDEGYRFWYEVEEEALAKQLPIVPEPDITESTSGLKNNYPRTISLPDENPIVIQNGPDTYEVTYRYVLTNQMAYCPKCNRPAFQISILQGELEHQCTAFIKDIQGKCLTKTTYIFLQPSIRRD